jgi:hypothetical protein
LFIGEKNFDFDSGWNNPKFKYGSGHAKKGVYKSVQKSYPPLSSPFEVDIFLLPTIR